MGSDWWRSIANEVENKSHTEIQNWYERTSSVAVLQSLDHESFLEKWNSKNYKMCNKFEAEKDSVASSLRW